MRSCRRLAVDGNRRRSRFTPLELTRSAASEVGHNSSRDACAAAAAGGGAATQTPSLPLSPGTQAESLGHRRTARRGRRRSRSPEKRLSGSARTAVVCRVNHRLARRRRKTRTSPRNAQPRPQCGPLVFRHFTVATTGFTAHHSVEHWFHGITNSTGGGHCRAGKSRPDSKSHVTITRCARTLMITRCARTPIITRCARYAASSLQDPCNCRRKQPKTQPNPTSDKGRAAGKATWATNTHTVSHATRGVLVSSGAIVTSQTPLEARPVGDTAVGALAEKHTTRTPARERSTSRRSALCRCS